MFWGHVTASALGTVLVFVVSVWVIIASVIAIREALDYGDDTLRAVAVAVLAYIPYLVLQGVIVAVASSESR